MRQGLTVVPAGLVMVVAMLGAGGVPEVAPANGVAVTDQRFGQPIAPIFLLLRPDIQADLELNRRQIDGAGALAARLVERLLAVRTKTGQAALSERREIDEMMAGWLHHELSEVQMERLDQISLQWEGAWAMLIRPSIREFLALGEPQRIRIARILDDRDRRHAAGTLSPAEFDRAGREAMAVLTPFQKERWESILGPPCRFSIRYPTAPTRVATADPSLRGRPRPPGR